MRLYPEYRKWEKGRYRGGDGLLVGCNSAQEWLLPWWWNNYSRHNSHPVTWVDLGLSPVMRNWCSERGELIILRIADIFVAEQEEVASDQAAWWESLHGIAFWNCRNAWFKKPSACLQTPYERTLWVDTDCEVLGSLEPIFEYCDSPMPISMRTDRHPSRLGNPVYNSGVIAYRWGLPFLETWASLAFDSNESFMGDQDILSQILLDEKIEVRQLSDRYNRYHKESHDDAVIIHWHGSNGKKIIASRLLQERLGELC